jgi:hypothetical protein
VLKRSLGEGFHLIGQGNTGMKTEPPSVKFVVTGISTPSAHGVNTFRHPLPFLPSQRVCSGVVEVDSNHRYQAQDGLNPIH